MRTIDGKVSLRKEDTMKTTLIVTHTDLDGVMAGLTAAQTSQSDATILYAEAGAPGIDAVLQQVLDDIVADKVRKPTHVILLDNTPSMQMLLQFNQVTGIQPVVYDHHVSNAPVWAEATTVARFITDDTGTSSATELVFKDQRAAFTTLPFWQTLVTLTNLYDTWMWQDAAYDDDVATGSTAQVLNEVLYFLGRERFSTLITAAKEASISSDEKPRELLTKIFSPVIMGLVDDRMAANAAYVLKKAEAAEFGDLTIGATTYHYAYVTASKQMSEIGNALTSLQDVDFGLVINNGALSFRVAKEKDVDVSLVAAAFNGGGHAKASGAKLRLDWPDILQQAATTEN